MKYFQFVFFCFLLSSFVYSQNACIYYSGISEDDKAAIWKVSENGSDSILVLELDDGLFLQDISSDGEKMLIYRMDSKTTSIFTFIDSSEIIINTNKWARSKFAFNDETIILMYDGFLSKYDTDTGVLAVLADSLRGECMFNFSPDKNKLVFYKYIPNTSDSQMVSIVNINTGEERVLTDDAKAGHDYGTSITWSYNNWIFYCKRALNEFNETFWDVAVVTTDGEKIMSFSENYQGEFFQPMAQHMFTDNECVIVEKISYDSLSQKKIFNLYKYDVSSNSLEFLANVNENNNILNQGAYTISWADDNQSIIYATAPYKSPSYIYKINVTTGLREYLASGYFPIWHNSEATNVSENTVLPSVLELHDNYPNPFNPTTKIEYSLAKSGNTRLLVFDILGNEIAQLINKHQEVGIYEIDFKASNLSSGVYLYMLRNNNTSITKKMLLLR